MKKYFILAAVTLGCAALVSSSFAAVNRVDVNGGLKSPWYSAGFVSTDPANHPYSWDYYQNGAGGGLGTRYDTGGSSNAYACQYEDETYPDDGHAQVYPGGHSVIFGGSGGAGSYGIKQTFNSSAGKLYWMFGSQRFVGGAGLYFDFGLQDGTAIDGGFKRSGNFAGSIQGRGTYFSYATIGTGSQMTAHIGTSATQTTGMNSFVDGIRIYELDIPIYNDLVNGDFEQVAQNQDMSGYGAKGTDTKIKNMMLMPGWLPMGSYATQIGRYATTVDGTNALDLDQYKGYGRETLFQRINKGDGQYDISGMIKTWDLNMADGRIGVDFSGGLDPNAASVVWTDKLNAVQVWTTKSLTGTSTSGNGITIFVSTGYADPNGQIASGTGLSRFDNISVNFTPVPEPSSIMALASGLIGMAGFAIRRRK